MQSNTTVVLICPNEVHRRNLVRALEGQHATVLAALGIYPNYNNLLSIIDADCDAFVIELDTDSDTALDLVETICTRKPSATVMVYCQLAQPELMLASMRAGAREFLTGALAPSVLADALLRAAARRADAIVKRTQGKVLMFCSSKGGSGVTTLACNFALALRQESGAEVALMDLNPQLGDVSLFLGIKPRFTINEALLNPNRLDEEFVSTMLTEHRSGVSVIAGPDVYTPSIPLEGRTIGKLAELVANRFPYVVIDAGTGLGESIEPIYQMDGLIYLVTQVDIPSLRNTQRRIAYIQRFNGAPIELVLNRFETRKIEFDEDRLTKAVGIAPKWKVPNDYGAVRRAANTGNPLISEKTPITGVLHQMARAACGKHPDSEKKRGFKLFG